MDDRSTAEILREMDERLRRIERRQINERRGRLLALCLVLAALAVLGVILAPKVMAVVEDYNRVMEELDKISAAINKLDINNVTKVFDKLSKLDTSGINTAVEKLNTALEPLLKFFSRG